MTKKGKGKVDQDLTPYLIIRESKASGRYDIVGAGNEDLPSSLKLIVHSNLHSTIQIPPKNKMSGNIFKVIGSQGSTLPSLIDVPYYNDLRSSIFVKPDNKMEGIADIIGYEESNLKGTIIPVVNENLRSTIHVRPHNKMEGIIDIEEPPVFKEVFTPVKDSFVRSGFPRLNYGSYLDMYVGNNSEEYRTLIEFNIDSLPKDKILKSATLVLHPANHITESIQLGIYNLKGSWNELGVTWDNQPQAGSLSTVFDSGRSFSEVRVNILDLVQAWYDGTEENNGLLIKVIEETLYSRAFYTRHSSFTPQLIIEYYEPFVISAGRANLPSNLFVHAIGNSDLKSTIDINPTWWDSELPSTVVVNDPHTLDGTIFINKPSLPSNIAVKQVGESDLPSYTVIRLEDDSWLEGSIRPRGQYREDLPSNLVVKYTSIESIPSNIDVYIQASLESSVSIRQGYDTDLLSQVTIQYASDLPSIVDIHKVSDLPSSLVVRAVEEENLPATITIHETSNLPSSIEILFGDYLQGNITVKYAGKEDLLSGIIVHNKDDLRSSLLVTNDNLPGSIIVHEIDDLESTLFIRTEVNSDLPSRLFARSFIDNNLPSVITVRLSGEEQINGSLLPRVERGEDLLSTVQISNISDLPSRLEIRRETQQDVPSTIEVTHQSEIPSSINVYEHVNLEGSLMVKNARVEDLPSKLKPRIINVSDLFSTIAIHEVSDLTSSIHVRGLKENDLPSSITVLEHDNLPSSVSVHHFDNLLSNVFVRVGETEDLPSTITVHEVDDLPSSLQLQLSNDLASSIRITSTNRMTGVFFEVAAIQNSDLPSNIKVLQHDNLPSKLWVRPTNKMEGIADIVGVGESRLTSTIIVGLEYKYPYAFIM